MDFHFKRFVRSRPQNPPNLELSMNWQRNARPRENHVYIYIYIYIATTCAGHFFLGCEIGQLVNLKTGGNLVSRGGGGVGGGGLWDIIGSDVRVSIWKPTPIIYLAFSLKTNKQQPIQILDNTES